jgi:hypothetical protein
MSDHLCEFRDRLCSSLGRELVLKQENERLRAALEKYGLHLSDCPANGDTKGIDPCNCGLLEARHV